MSGFNRADRVDAIINYIQRSDPEKDVIAKAVALRLRRAAHYVDTQVKRNLPQGMDVWEMDLLATLMRRGGTLTVGQLQDVAQLTSGAITNRVTRLEKDGYLTREINLQDRRQIVVTLTEAGRARAAEVMRAHDEAQHTTLEKVDRPVLERLAEDLRAFLLAVEGPAPDEEMSDPPGLS